MRHSGIRLPRVAELKAGLTFTRACGPVKEWGCDRRSRSRGAWASYRAMRNGSTLRRPGFEVTSRSSPIYNEEARRRAGIFHRAESWAFAHMLYLSPEYADNFGKFVTALSRGKRNTEPVLCRIAWGKTGDQVMSDLESYAKRKRSWWVACMKRGSSKDEAGSGDGDR